MQTHEERLARARVSLEGLSLGDSLGGFLEGLPVTWLAHREKLPQWAFEE